MAVSSLSKKMANVFETELLYLSNSERESDDNESVLYKALLKYRVFIFYIFISFLYYFILYFILLNYPLNGRCRSPECRLDSPHV